MNANVMEVHSQVSDPARSVRELIEEGLPVDPDWALLSYHNKKLGKDVQVLFPSREAAKRRAKKLGAEKVARRPALANRTIGEVMK